MCRRLAADVTDVLRCVGVLLLSRGDVTGSGRWLSGAEHAHAGQSGAH